MWSGTSIIARLAGVPIPLLAALAASAQGASDAELGEQVLLELNSVQPAENGCTLTFQVINGHASGIDRAVYETVLFDGDGQVRQMTLFDFGALPPARPRVRQFTVRDMACETLGKVLINGAHSCEAADLAPGVCEDTLKTGTRTGIEVLG